MVKVKDTDNIIGLKEDIISRIEDIADVERVYVYGGLTYADRCVCCGAIIPEGRQVCPICEKQSTELKYFTPEDVRRMTAKDVRDNYTAVMESMKKWEKGNTI